MAIKKYGKFDLKRKKISYGEGDQKYIQKSSCYFWARQYDVFLMEIGDFFVVPSFVGYSTMIFFGLGGAWDLKFGMDWVEFWVQNGVKIYHFRVMPGWMRDAVWWNAGKICYRFGFEWENWVEPSDGIDKQPCPPVWGGSTNNIIVGGKFEVFYWWIVVPISRSRLIWKLWESQLVCVCTVIEGVSPVTNLLLCSQKSNFLLFLDKTRQKYIIKRYRRL